MRPYKQQDWYIKEVEKYLEKYSVVPPPWVYDPESHPYSMQWRMGAGETLIMVFGGWAEDALKTEDERIEYCKKYSPPPRWLAWCADFVWGLEPWQDENFDYSPYLEKLKNLGFDGTFEYESDLNDEKWLSKG
jgi:hypothetical protein